MRKTRTSLRDLLLPAVSIRDDSDARTRPATGSLAKNISSPCLVSSTNAALDPYYLERPTARQPDSPVEVFQFACASDAEFSDTSADVKRGSRVMLMTQQLHVSAPSIEHNWSLVEVGDVQDTPDLESVYSSDSADPDQHSMLSMPTIPRIAFEDLSDSDSSTSIKKTYDFKITTVGASVRLGDYLKPPKGSHISPSRSLPSPEGTRRRHVRVFDITKHSDVLSAPVRRLPIKKTALEDLRETRNESEDDTKHPISDIRLGFVGEGGPYQQSDLSKEDGNTPARGANSNLDGPFMKSFRVYPGLDLSAVVHFRGKHRRSRAASYQVTTETLTERCDLRIQPFSGSPNDSRWSPKDGVMIVKVYIPSTDDIWAAYFPTNVTLFMFTRKWVSRLSLHLRFSGSTMDTPEYYFDDDDFQYWIKHRVRNGRNLPIVGHLDYAVPLPPVIPNET